MLAVRLNKLDIETCVAVVSGVYILLGNHRQDQIRRGERL